MTEETKRHEARFVFYVDHRGEPLAGIGAYTDTVTITIESGDPGEVGAGEFASHSREALESWFLGANVTGGGHECPYCGRTNTAPGYPDDNGVNSAAYCRECERGF